MQIKEAISKLKWNIDEEEAHEALGLTEARVQEMINKAGDELTRLSTASGGVHGWEIIKVSVEQAETLEEALYMAFHAGHYIGITDSSLNKIVKTMKEV